MRKAIFFDAAGTLIRLTRSVGEHYAMVGHSLGLVLDPAALDRAFAEIWKEMPMRPATGLPREDDDKGWWRDLVGRLLGRIKVKLEPLEVDAFFQVAYAHFAEAGVWECYPEVAAVLLALQSRFELAVISNFDGRLRMILEHLSISHFFGHVFLSSELGADKPDPAIYRRALEISGIRPDEALHVGDDPERDWSAARMAGLEVFRLHRPYNSLRDLLSL